MLRNVKVNIFQNFSHTPGAKSTLKRSFYTLNCAYNSLKINNLQSVYGVFEPQKSVGRGCDPKNFFCLFLGVAGRFVCVEMCLV